mgnify:CR=1 FL=1
MKSTPPQPSHCQRKKGYENFEKGAKLWNPLADGGGSQSCHAHQHILGIMCSKFHSDDLKTGISLVGWYKDRNNLYRCFDIKKNNKKIIFLSSIIKQKTDCLN